MAVDVYWWHGKKWDDTGHASLLVTGGSPAGDEYLSAWPGSGWSVVAVGSANFHTYQMDLDDYGSPQVVRLTKLDETAIKARIKVWKSNGIYSFSLANCASQTGACLREGVSSTVPYPYPNTPWAVYYYALALKPFYA